MTAQRFGSALTDITGTSKQLLRVKNDESGFEFVDPPQLNTYTITNDSTDRIINASDVTLDEVGNVLATLIKDLNNGLYFGGISPGLIALTPVSITNPNFPTSTTQVNIAHGLGKRPDEIHLFAKKTNGTMIAGPYAPESITGNQNYVMSVRYMYGDSTHVRIGHGMFEMFSIGETFNLCVYVR